MVHFKFLILEGLKVSKVSVWAMIRKYKRHGTISHLPGSGWSKLRQIIHKLFNSHLSFGNIRLCINDYVLRKLPVMVNS